MQDFEKLGVFYLGRIYDLKENSRLEQLVLYDSKDLVTHGVCVGMTGSGKTGLCISILEEAALDGVPSIVIDPKGDITNLLLTFRGLSKEEFLPWVNEEDAAKKGLSLQDYAAAQADSWKKGLADWGQDGTRIKQLRDCSDFIIYTPGSNAGIPISILRSFEVPPRQILEDEELLQERVTTMVTSLLGLIGIEADPIKSREHILLSTILSISWKAGISLDLADLIMKVQKPSVQRVGVLELESFYPSRERFELAMQLNNLLASPSFQLWLEGPTLDISQFLYEPSGKPKVSIFYIAHLNDAERMFFVSLLLNNLIGWMRMQSGTTSLRALLYIDEVFGYLPPVANPPSKMPLMTLLKQARAFGLGVLVATQNPVDLDYKGLSNAGTWFIGRLQTDRDKLRLLDALEGIAGRTGSSLRREDYNRIISSLCKRIFLMHSIYEEAPIVFETRWAMSYLRGPLTREQIKVLMDPMRMAAQPSTIHENVPGAEAEIPILMPSKAPPSSDMPILPPGVDQRFLPVMMGEGSGKPLYIPMLLGFASVRFADTKSKIDAIRDLSFITPLTDGPVAVNWEESKVITPAPKLLDHPAENSSFADLPQVATDPKRYTAWQKDFVVWLLNSQRLVLMSSPSLGQVSNVGESESDFRVRLQLAAREKRDEAAEKIRKRYTPKMARLDDRIRKAQMAVERVQLQAKEQHYQTAVLIGTSLLGAFLGRRGTSGARTTARDLGRSLKQREGEKDSKENMEALRKERADLDAEFQSELDAMEKKIDPLTEQFEKLTIAPKKGDISLQLLTLVWSPEEIDDDIE
jgi:hypothetical protein